MSAGTSRAALVGLVLWAAGAGRAGAQEASSLAGAWAGTLEPATGVTLRVVFHLAPAEDGGLTATLDSPDQGAFGIPGGTVDLTGDSVTVPVAAVGGRFRGTVAEDGDRIEGSWTQGGMTFPLTLERTTEEATKPKRPQEPSGPLPYDADEVAFPGGASGVRLAGTLTRPRGDGPFPAVVLVTGSGPQDRNETVFGHKPFLVLSDWLTRRGIAVLRYDDRGVGASTGNFGAADTRDFAADAAAALDFLREQERIAPDRAGMLGHSEGADVAPLVATGPDSAAVAFVVLLAPTGMPGDTLLLLQGHRIAQAQGASAQAIASQRALQERMFEIVRTESDTARAHELLMEALQGAGLPEAAARPQAAAMLSPWMRFFLTYDPLPALERLRVPVLVIIGSKDLQVPAAENLPPIRAALEKAGNPDATVLELPGLNHLLQRADTGAPSEYAGIEETMDPAALQAISDWILERFGPDAGGD